MLEEAQHLAKPSSWLLPSQAEEDCAGVFGGCGPSIDPPSVIKHVLTVDLAYLPGGFDTPSRLTIYNDASRLEGTALLHNARIPLSGEALGAHERQSLPPVEALFKFGSSSVQAWLAENNWQPSWGYNDNFPDAAVVHAYERHYQDQHPLYADSVVAVLGGWHFAWPDEDWHDRLHDRLILTIYREAEPWVEAWHTNGEIQIANRVS